MLWSAQVSLQDREQGGETGKDLDRPRKEIWPRMAVYRVFLSTNLAISRTSCFLQEHARY